MSDTAAQADDRLDVQVHGTAIVHAGADLGAGGEVGPYSVIGPGVTPDVGWEGEGCAVSQASAFSCVRR